jgi:hypothetical protein
MIAPDSNNVMLVFGSSIAVHGDLSTLTAKEWKYMPWK